MMNKVLFTMMALGKTEKLIIFHDLYLTKDNNYRIQFDSIWNDNLKITVDSHKGYLQCIKQRLFSYLWPSRPKSWVSSQFEFVWYRSCSWLQSWMQKSRSCLENFVWKTWSCLGLETKVSFGYNETKTEDETIHRSLQYLYSFETEIEWMEHALIFNNNCSDIPQLRFNRLPSGISFQNLRRPHVSMIL